MRLEHKAGGNIIHELAINQYPSSFECFREAVSNALDEGTEKVEILTSLKEVIVEDWGEGIRDVDKFALYGEASKAKLGGQIIGQKGLGKLSLLRLSNKVNFRTNNGDYGIDIVMTPDNIEYNIGAVSRFLDHKGTQIVIPNPTDLPPLDELSQYLKKTFGLRIAKGLKLILNGTALESKSRIDPSEHFLFRLKGADDVTGNIKHDKKAHGTLDFYIKHVFVSSVMIDPSRKFTGWVNCDSLIPTTSRNEILKNDIYHDLVDHLRQFVSKFPKAEEEISKDEILVGHELDKMLKGYLKDMKLLPQGKILFGKGQEPALNKQDKKSEKRLESEEHEVLPDYVKVHSTPKTNKPIKRTVKTNYGVMWVDQDAGNEKDPIFFVEPNIVVKNRTNDLYKFALRTKPSLGPKWLRLTPYLARLAVTINPESAKWTREQMYHEMDEAIRYFLKHKDELK